MVPRRRKFTSSDRPVRVCHRERRRGSAWIAKTRVTGFPVFPGNEQVVDPAKRLRPGPYAMGSNTFQNPGVVATSKPAKSWPIQSGICFRVGNFAIRFCLSCLRNCSIAYVLSTYTLSAYLLSAYLLSY